MEQNISLAKDLAGLDVWLKVGLRSFIRDGWNFVEELKKVGGQKIFLDLKLYDIPNTMADAAEEIVKSGLVEMFNIHASAGKEAMSTVMQRIGSLDNRPLVFAVTALTSFDRDTFFDIYSASIDEKAAEFAQWSYHCGLDGVVCSVHESRLIKYATKQNFMTLCPGIRPNGEEKGDQKRVSGIEFAMDEMVDFAVVGRPIYQSGDKKATTLDILNQVENYSTDLY
jgi:orotidine-5'-phosphate decarboxylase